MELEKIRKDILSGKAIEEVAREFSWKEFEEFVAEIFRENNFRVKRSFRFKTRKKYEIDIIAIKQKTVLCVDCKEWGKGRYKKHGLKNSAKNQERRIKEFKSFLKKNPIVQDLLKIDSQYNFYSLIVTLLEEDLIIEGATFFVPIWKLNSFLQNIEEYLSFSKTI
jgi:Holliday junction resolvase-like predicted endonuclease